MGGWLLRLFLTFSLGECLDLGALFDLRSEGKLLRLPIDVELDFSGSHINVSIHGAQERPPQDERGLGVGTTMSRTTKSAGLKKFHIFTGIFSAIPTG